MKKPPESIAELMEKVRIPLDGLTGEQVKILENTEVSGVTADSRKVTAGTCFVALRGQHIDGHGYVADAQRSGAALAVVEKIVPDVGIPQLVVPDTEEILASLCAAAAGNPERDMTFIGVTGTNGKTTITTLVYRMLQACGFVPGLIGTVAYHYGEVVEPSIFTSPVPEILFPLLARMRGAGVDTVVMEVSSHGLALQRMRGIRFRIGVLTNFTQDHLDFHGTMEEYARAKSLLFSEYMAPESSVVAWTGNPDMGRIIPPDTPVVGYDLAAAAGVTVHATDLELSIEGLRFEAHTPSGSVRIHSPLIGEHNVQNLLAACAIAHLLGLNPEQWAPVLEKVTVSGRLARVFAGDVPVFVDYAHTPDALDRSQMALRPLTRGRLITVFGCGGDRDRNKRPKMGHSVRTHSDLAVVTSDNPRTEDPVAIIGEILEGTGPADLQETDLASAPRGVFVEPDRARAIATVIAAARPEDAVLIAGKGHEDYQIVGTQKFHFDDSEHARDALLSRKRG